jgi:heme/copper-type cytochrome/quinol oxidase subunit 2
MASKRYFSGCVMSRWFRTLEPVFRLLLVLILIGFCCQLAEGCPGCKNALAENDPQHARMVSGYFWSILFMMGMPFALAGTFGTFCYLEIRRKRAEQPRDEEIA